MLIIDLPMIWLRFLSGSSTNILIVLNLLHCINNTQERNYKQSVYIDYSPQAVMARIETNKLNSVDWYGLRPNLWKGEGSDRKISKIGQYETDRICGLGLLPSHL